jgi:hypothetical protein
MRYLMFPDVQVLLETSSRTRSMCVLGIPSNYLGALLLPRNELIQATDFHLSDA